MDIVERLPETNRLKTSKSMKSQATKIFIDGLIELP